MSAAIVPAREAQALVALDEAKRAIQLARDTGEADVLLEWRDRAEAFAHYHRCRDDAREVADDAGEVKVRAEAALGQLDAEAAPASPGRPKMDNGGVSHSAPLADVRPNTRANWRKLGKLKPEQLDTVVEQLRAEDDGGVTTTRAVRVARKVAPVPKPSRTATRRKRRSKGAGLEDWLPDMLPGAEPTGAFRQAVKGWCDQERVLRAALENTGITLVPKSKEDRAALLTGLAAIRKLAVRLEGQVKK